MKSHAEADAVRVEVRPVALANSETENHKGGHGGEFGPGRNILEQRAPTQAHDVYTSEHGDKQQSEHMGASKGDAGERENYMLLRNDREDLAGICCRRDRERGDRAAVCHGEQHPSIEKSDEISVSLAQVNVLAAGLGKHGSKLSEGDTAEQRNYAADHPHQQEQHGLRQRSGNVFGGEEDRRADDAAD